MHLNIVSRHMRPGFGVFAALRLPAHLHPFAIVHLCRQGEMRKDEVYVTVTVQ